MVSFYKDSVEGEGVSGAFIAETVKKELFENEGVLSNLYSKFNDEDEVTSFTIEVRGELHRILVSKNPLKKSSTEILQKVVDSYPRPVLCLQHRMIHSDTPCPTLFWRIHHD